MISLVLTGEKVPATSWRARSSSNSFFTGSAFLRSLELGDAAAAAAAWLLPMLIMSLPFCRPPIFPSVA